MVGVVFAFGAAPRQNASVKPRSKPPVKVSAVIGVFMRWNWSLNGELPLARAQTRRARVIKLSASAALWQIIPQ